MMPYLGLRGTCQKHKTTLVKPNFWKLLKDGTVLIRSPKYAGGKAALRGVDIIYSKYWASAAALQDGTVVT